MVAQASLLEILLICQLSLTITAGVCNGDKTGHLISCSIVEVIRNSELASGFSKHERSEYLSAYAARAELAGGIWGDRLVSAANTL